jgi:NADH-quinone oxidoreductase subunit L
VLTDIAPVFLPLIGFLIAFLFGKRIGDHASQFVTCACLIAAAGISIWLFYDVALMQHVRSHILMTWISSGDFDVSWDVRLDTLSVVMMCVITIVSSCVHVYSVGYMHHDDAQARFMSYLSLFTFAMMMLVSADNLVQLFFGWEGVGLASYLLIGFWNYKHSANAAAIKAFIVNRVGDLGLALGTFACLMLFGSLQYDVIFSAAPSMVDVNFEFLGMHVPAVTLICLLLFIGACGKSAQLGLHTWLPDAMEGPTPVSALIHAATMVTAGVFLVCRFSPLFQYSPEASMVVTFVGAATAIFAATIGMTQFDIKRVIAYSTMSQLGYMFFAAGVGAYGAAMFHLVTHAFFKALLFLGAGSVIHAVGGEQDMRKMGGLWKLIPTTYVLMWIGSLALAGIPFFAGYYSKDMILEADFAAHTGVSQFAFEMGILAAALTAFYSWRLIIMTFHGKPRANDETMHHVHESPMSMLAPLFVLAFGAVFAGRFLFPLFVGANHVPFWGRSIFVLEGHDLLEAAEHVPHWVPILPLIVALTGIALAYLSYLWRTDIPGTIARIFKPVYLLFFNKWYVDELYDAMFVKPAWVLGRGFFHGGDQAIINGLGPDGLAKLSSKGAGALSFLQTGYVYHYAFVMIISIVAFMGWLLLKLQGQM